ncbi:NHLP leader peptide family natural product precursor [Cohnella sp. CIP 111063]|jgi:peroxiredoxin|uniref:NHLP leader peptide family RiPP precursor n=1 Tax=unclassified Cohnella TaxID=2636738 RepID=UPI000B8BE0D6|nr:MULTISPECIES: NHLP leader peptide family RiPP precursor [unclassified Cohnella]OXS57545.1 NHLP leader peptide family natural product precursor [Cohnella sp. CIP 111063]PRX70923.1 putative ribosomally synthesized peptide [Cohnella sp. SGD-V74]
MSLESLKVQIIKKAWEDPAFKSSLLSDPKEAIKAAFGVEIPAGIELKAVEETSSQYYLVIPPNPEDVSVDPAPNIVW